MTLLEAKLRRVLDGEDALRVRNKCGERVEERRFPRARPAGDDRVETHLHASPEELGQLGRQRTGCYQVIDRHLVLTELSDGHRRALWRHRRDDNIDTGAVCQASVYHGRRLVDSPTERRHDTLDDAHDMGVVTEADRAEIKPTFLFIEDLVRIVHHHF